MDEEQSHLITISPNDKKAIIDILQKDVHFFVSQKIMDYSLLFGIERLSQDNINKSYSIKNNLLPVKPSILGFDYHIQQRGISNVWNKDNQNESMMGFELI